MKLLKLLLLISAITACQKEDIGVDGGAGQAIDKKPVELVNPNAKGKLKSVSFTGDTSVVFTYFYDNIGHLTDSLWVSKNNVKTLYTLGFDENQRVVSLSNKTGLQRAFLHNAAGLLAAVEEQPTTKTFTYAAGLLSTLRYSSAAARTVASYAWRGTILNSVKSNGTTGEEEITYQISTEKANTLQQFFISQLGVLPVDFPLTTAYLLKSESHFFAGKTYGYEYAFEQDKITAITKSEQNGTTPKVVQKIEVSYY